MKVTHALFFALKVIIVLQFLLILLNKETMSSNAYLITEIVFKISLGLFMDYLMIFTKITGLSVEDKIIISFAGGLLSFDAVFNDLPILLANLRKK